MRDSSLTTDLGRVLVTGGSGFVGANLVTELLDRGHHVRSFDRVPSPLPEHAGLETVVGDITMPDPGWPRSPPTKSPTRRPAKAGVPAITSAKRRAWSVASAFIG